MAGHVLHLKSAHGGGKYIRNRRANGTQKTQNRAESVAGVRDSFVAADYINATITSGNEHNKWIMLENTLFNFHRGIGGRQVWDLFILIVCPEL